MRLLTGDCRDILPTLDDGSVHCVVTSPPYFGLRDYGVAGQLGLEPTPEAYVEAMVGVFREVRRVLRDDGTVWLNLGDSYAQGGQERPGSSDAAAFTPHDQIRRRPGIAKPRVSTLKPKDLVGIPWRVAFALQADGWYLRSDIIWSKPNPMPESVTDRPTKAHEYVFLLSKRERYWYDAAAIREPATPDHGRTVDRSGVNGQDDYRALANGQPPHTGLHRRTDKQRGHGRRHDGFNDRWDQMTKAEQQALGRNKRSVWTIATQPYPEAHFATFPEALVEPCILAGCPEGGTVLDPFGGSGTVGAVAERLSRRAILIELSPEYVRLAEQRTAQAGLGLSA